MSEKQIPTVKEICTFFRIKCEKTKCELCKLKKYGCSRESGECLCLVAFTTEVLTGKMDLFDPLWEKEPKPKTKVPAWCKVGAWVTDEYSNVSGSYRPYCIKDVTDGFVRFGVLAWNEVLPADKLKPVRFRPYTFEEAKGLLGKVMEYPCRDGETTICLIGNVTSETLRPESEVMINHWKQEAFFDAGATIDGVPFGVPEIDEEALKGGQE